MFSFNHQTQMNHRPLSPSPLPRHADLCPSKRNKNTSEDTASLSVACSRTPTLHSCAPQIGPTSRAQKSFSWLCASGRNMGAAWMMFCSLMCLNDTLTAVSGIWVTWTSKGNRSSSSRDVNSATCAPKCSLSLRVVVPTWGELSPLRNTLFWLF